MPEQRKGRNGGTLTSRSKGDPALPGAGRPKKLPMLDKLLDEVLGQDPNDPKAKSDALEVLESLVKAAKKGNVQAQIAVLDRAYGKPKQAVEHTGKDGEEIQVKKWIIEVPAPPPGLIPNYDPDKTSA